MSVATAKAGLKACMQTLVTSGDVKAVVNGRPSTAHNLPLIYLESTDGERVQRGQLTVNKYHMDAVACVPFQDNILSEDMIDALINKMAAAVDDNPTLGHVVNVATGTNWRADTDAIAEVLVRRVVWSFEITDKGVFGGTV